MATTNEDLARLLVSIEFTQKQSEKQLAAIAKRAAREAQGIEDSFQGANDNIGKGFETSGKKVERSLGAQRAAVSNLSFQLNDVAQQLATGTSPFTVMVQQGSQVAQIFQGSGGIVGAVKTLGGALTSMVNPVSLASFALIGLTGYAVQYFSEVFSGGEKSEKVLKEEAELIGRVAQKWGEALPTLKKYNDERQKLADQNDLTTATEAVAQGQYGAIRKVIEDVRLEIASLVIDLQQAGSEDEDILRLQNSFNGLYEQIEAGKANTEQLRQVQSALATVFKNTGIPAADAMSKSIGNIADELERAIETANSARFEAAMQKLYELSPIGTLQPLVSGGGKFLNPMEQQDFAFNEAQLQQAGDSAAAKMIKSFEGFMTNSYWDVNAYRAGFGSDTTTRANGMIERVTKDTVVSLDDAERDLSRRIIEFQNGVQKAIGVDTWRSLSEAQQAALTSIAYNYGSLPDTIVAAIQQGGGPEKVAKAIAALSANPDRRKQEASAYLSGTGVSMSDAGLSTSSRKRSPAEIFQGDIAEVQKRIDVLNGQYEAQARLNPLIDDYGYAVEKAKIQQQLLAEAQKAGLTVTPELAASIGSLAENYAKASAASEMLQVSQERVRQSAQEWKTLGKDVTSGFISDLRRGVSASDALANALNKVLDKLIDIGLNSLFGLGGGGGGLFGGGGGLLGGMLIPGILHSGGVAGSDGYGHGRAVSPSTFAGAKRYHTGGVAGLQPGEVPAILQRGEVVLPRGTKMGGKQNVHVTVGVSSDSNGNLMPFVQSVSQGQVEKAAPKIVSAANQRVVPTMAAYQSNKAGAEWRT